ncbi:MAG TPA: hypothetical protein VK400_00035 [Pyrinomonadaceae bacterium]|nr:hypothetical protein [Pyrinomonadaceae bacterium]
MKNRRIIIKALLLITISISFAAGVFAQAAGGETLVAGNPPLTGNDADEIMKYYERNLEMEFSAAERAEFQTILVNQWRRAQKSGGKNLAAFLKTVTTINGWDAAKRERLKGEIREAVLGDLRSSAGSELSRFVLSVYENAGGENSTTAQADENRSETTTARTETESETRSETKENFRPVEGTIKIADLVGKWNKGSVASYGYRDRVSNDYKSGYGAANQHDIYANGGFDYTNYAQISLYNCTTELFTSMKGRLAVSGSQVTFTYVSGTVKGKDSCKTDGFTKPAQIRTTTYRVERDGNQIRLCEIGAEQSYCLYKAKE